MGLRAPKSKNGLQKPRETLPQNGGIDIWFIHLAFLGDYQANFVNLHFFIVLEPFSTLKGKKIKKYVAK